MKKFVLFLMTILILSLATMPVCLADDAPAFEGGTATSGGNTLGGLGIGLGGNIDSNLSRKVNVFIGALQIIGYVAAAIIIVYVGVKFILASGDEKADLKGAMPKYLMGAILIIFCDVIGTWIFNLFK